MAMGADINYRPAALAALLLASCSAQQPTKTAAARESEAETPATTATIWPSGIVVVGDGFPKSGNPCRRIGESARTAELLDDSALLVGCPGDPAGAETAAIVAMGGRVVGAVANVTMISVALGDANAGMVTADNPSTTE